MSLPEPGTAEKNQSLDKEPSAEPLAEKPAEITEDSPGENKDEVTEGPPAKKKAENVFPTEKSAVQLLQEHSDKSGEEVEYEWDTVGGSSQLRFICRVRVGKEVFTGAGISKKAAKQSAAGAALEVLDLQVDSTPADAPKAHAFTPEGDNPISVLNQLTSRKKIPTPEYDLVEEQVMANRTQFTMFCRVGKVMETGSGPCKKVAKQAAALKVLEKLKRDQSQEGETRTVPTNHAVPSRHFSEHRRETNDRARVSPYPSTTRPFQEYRRGPTSQTFNSTLERNAQYPLSEAFPRLDHNAEEMHRAPECLEQGALNSATTRPLMGNQRCHSAHEFPREPMGRARYPLAHGSLNSGMDMPLLAHQQQDVAQELNKAPRDDTEFHLARPTLNSGTVRPLMEVPQDHSAQEKHIVSGNNALEPRFQRTLNTGTIGPLLGHPQHPSSQILNRSPGGSAQYPLAQQSLNSGLNRPSQTHKQDSIVPEFHPATKDNTQFQLARASLNPGTVRPPMEHRGYPSTQELDIASKNNTQYPWPQTSLSTGMIRPVQEHAQQLNTAQGKNAEYKVTPLELSNTPNRTPEQQRGTSAQELNTTLGHNAGYSGAFMNPTMIKPLQEHQQDPSTLGLGHNAGYSRAFMIPTMIKPLQEHQQDPSTRGMGHNMGYMCSSLNSAMVKPHQEHPQDPSSKQSNKIQGNDAPSTWSQASQNTAAIVPSPKQQVELKSQESSSAPTRNGGLTFPLYTMKPTSIFGPALKHQQESSAEQVTTQPGNSKNVPLVSPSPTSINPLVGLWQGAQALGFNMK